MGQNNIFRIFSPTFLTLIFCGLVFQSCWNTGDKIPVSGNLSPAITDSVHQLLSRLYAESPDSAIVVSNKFILQLDSMKAFSDLIDMYMYLAELYQYRRDNNLYASANLIKALRLIAAHPEIKDLDPYYFIDIGNIFYRYGLYNHANTAYREALDIARETNLSHPAAVALQNIALGFHVQKKYDSARRYFNLAEKCLYGVNNLQMAQNYLYLCSLELEAGKTDSIHYWLEKSQSLLDYNELILDKSDAACYFKDSLLIREMRARNFISLSGLYDKVRMKNDSMNYFLRLALLNASQAGSQKLISEICFNLARLYASDHDHRQAVIFADSALKYSILLKDYPKMIQYSEFISTEYAMDKNPVKARAYHQKAQMFSDSLQKEKESDQFTEEKVELMYQSMDISLQNVKKTREAYSYKIHQQHIIIWLIVLAAAVIIASLLAESLHFRKLRYTRLQLAQRTYEMIEVEELSVQKKIPGLEADMTTQLKENLEEMMRTEKPYFNAELKLNDLASMLGTNYTYLSQLINQHYSLHYNDYINNMRVKEACHLMTGRKDKNLTIDMIASQVGFSTKSTFYVAFKKFTGVSPAIYIKMCGSNIPLARSP
ncbi:MAG: helix-turn-helix domain-containing protein [Bacteroidota bacterium]